VTAQFEVDLTFVCIIKLIIYISTAFLLKHKDLCLNKEVVLTYIIDFIIHLF